MLRAVDRLVNAIHAAGSGGGGELWRVSDGAAAAVGAALSLYFGAAWDSAGRGSCPRRGGGLQHSPRFGDQ